MTAAGRVQALVARFAVETLYTPPPSLLAPTDENLRRVLAAGTPADPTPPRDTELELVRDLFTRVYGPARDAIKRDMEQPALFEVTA